MKRISLLVLALFCSASMTMAQDAATQDQLNRLNGLVQVLLEDKANQKKQIEDLASEVQAAREQAAKPQGNFASQEELRKLAEKVQEIDRKREADKELILKEIDNLAKLIKKYGTSRPVASSGSSRPSTSSDKGYEYEVQPGDTISVIVQAYRDQGIKVSVDQVLKANPGLVPEKMAIGQKIFIPAPGQ